MSSIAVVVDSTADLPQGAIEFGVAVVPLMVIWDGQAFRDRVDLTTAQFYQRLQGSKTMPTTGAPGLQAFQTTYHELLKTHDGIVAIVLPAKLSATFDHARQAANEVAPDRIAVIDGGTITRCTGWLAESALAMSANGSNLGEICASIEKQKQGARVFAILDTLAFLQRGGRIGRARAFAGTLLSIKPILEIRDGDVLPRERVRTIGAAIRRVVENVVGLANVERLAVLHGAAPTNADELYRQLTARFPLVAIERGEIGTVLGTHAGPGVFGVAAMTRPA